AAAFSPRGDSIARVSNEKKERYMVDLWDLATGKCKAKLDQFAAWVSSIDFSPDGTTLATGLYDNTVQLWDVGTGQRKGKQLKRHTKNNVSAVAFSPCGTTLASGSWDKTVRLWDVATGKRKGAPLKGHEGQVRSVVFSPDGSTLASASGDKTV